MISFAVLFCKVSGVYRKRPKIQKIVYGAALRHRPGFLKAASSCTRDLPPPLVRWQSYVPPAIAFTINPACWLRPDD